MRQSSGFAFAADSDESRQDVVRPTHGLSAVEDFHHIVDRYDGDRYFKSMTCAEQFA
jgi:hypothetical protein